MEIFSSAQEKGLGKASCALPKPLYYFQIKMHQDAPRIFHSG